MSSEILVDVFAHDPSVYEHPMLISLFVDGAFEKSYKPWKYRIFNVRQSGLVLISKKSKKTDRLIVSSIIHIKTFHISLIQIEDTLVEHLKGNVGIEIECLHDSADGLPTNFRALMKRVDVFKLCLQVKNLNVSSDNNIDKFIDEDLKPTYEEQCESIAVESISVPRLESMQMKVKVLDRTFKVTTKQKIIKQRGAFKWLPVLFTTDLVHASWWFVFGSLWMALIGALVLISTYYHSSPLGTDDSTFSIWPLRAIWIMFLIMGVFFTLGSMAWIRAVHEPPMKPLFTWYHLSTDALLGAWLFFLAMLPAIPYACIFLYYSPSVLYVGMLIVAILCVFGTYLFVVTCYPSKESADHASRKIFTPYVKVLFCGAKFIDNHCPNDWLLACWVIFWGSFLSVILTDLYVLYGIAINESAVNNFVNVTGFLDCIFFTIGAAYFVAGSYVLPKYQFTPDYVENAVTSDDAVVKNTDDNFNEV